MRSLSTAIVVSCAILFASSCGGGNGGSSTASPLSGNWQMALVKTGSGTNQNKTLSGFLLQSGDSVSGSLSLGGQTSCAGVGGVAGELSGTNLTMTVAQTGQTVNLTGMMGAGASAISGNYSILSSPCGDTSVGTWTASLVSPLNGNFQGTFTSTVTSGLVFHFSGMVAQAANTGSSIANLSGTMSSTDAPCFNTATITGAISGTSVVFNLVSSEGIALGQYRGTTTTDATSITGNYDIFNPNSPPTGGCTDIGTAVVTLQ